MRNRWSWWMQFLGVLILPFMLVSGIWEVAMLHPGTLKVEHWRNASSLIYMIGTVPAIILLRGANFRPILRRTLAIGVLLVMLLSAFFAQIHSRCGDEPIFIGSKGSVEMVVACE